MEYFFNTINSFSYPFVIWLVETTGKPDHVNEDDKEITKFYSFNFGYFYLRFSFTEYKPTYEEPLQ